MKLDRLVLALSVLTISPPVFAEPYAAKCRHPNHPPCGKTRQCDGLSADGEERAKAYVNYFRRFAVAAGDSCLRALATGRRSRHAGIGDSSNTSLDVERLSRPKRNWELGPIT
jgi:hypothetical protein